MRPFLGKYLYIVLILLAGAASYANSLQGEFIWDDAILVRDNVLLRDWHNFGRIFTQDLASGGANRFHYYRPLQALTYLADYSFWQGRAFGYHLTNLSIHLACALALYWLVAILFSDSLLAFFCAVLFVAHPVHAEAVSYISGRAEPLHFLFMLLGFISYLKYLASGRLSNLIFLLLAYSCALLSMESALILPFLFLLYHWLFRRKLNLKVFLLILGVSGLYLWLRLSVFASLQPYLSSPAPFLKRLPGFFCAFFNYLRLLIFPFGMHQEYGKRLFSLSNPQVIAGIVLFCALLACAIYWKKKKPAFSFGILWFFLGLAPVANLFYPVIAYMAEHWLYLPAAGFFLTLAYFLRRGWSRPQARRLSGIIFIAALLFYCGRAIAQNRYWQSALGFYRETLKYNPDSPRMNNNLGLLYYEMGRREEGIRLYKKAIAADAGFSDAYNNLANAYNQAGRKKEAEALYLKAIEESPFLPDPYNNLANLYAETSRESEAEILYRKAVKVNPYYAKAYHNLGVLYQRLGRQREAAEAYESAIAIDPRLAVSYLNLALLYLSSGQREFAIGYCRKAASLGSAAASGLLQRLEAR